MESEKSNCESLFTENLTLDVCSVITAAGLSSRMGCWKGELPVPSTNVNTDTPQISLIEKSVETALNCCRTVILVGGEHMSRIKRIFSGSEKLILVENRDYLKGMLSSIQAGLVEVDRDFFIHPMDMPLITTEHYYRIHREYLSSLDDSPSAVQKLYRPVFKDMPGHPVFMPFSWKNRVLAMTGSSLKSNLKSEDQVYIPWEDTSVVLDLDTMDSYKNFVNDYSK